MIQMRGIWVDGPFARDTLSENQNWMIQMRGVRVDGSFFQGYTFRKSKLDVTDERCKGIWTFFRDTQSENQN
jgi:hypothetical protein